MPSNSGTSSGLKSANAAIMPAAGRLLSVSIIGDGTNPCTLTIYDNPSAASGLVLAKVALAAGEAASGVHLPNDGMVANQGLYAVVSGTGAEYIIGYSLG